MKVRLLLTLEGLIGFAVPARSTGPEVISVIGWTTRRPFSSTRAGRNSVSAPKPNLEGDVLLLDPKTKFLSLTHADDTGLRESRRRIRSESRPSATKPRKLLVLVAVVIAMITSSTASAAPPTLTQLLTGLEGGSGSTVGPDGALYVTESAAGRISRVDPRTGEITTFASGLPKSIVGFGGAIDVAFIGGTAYALVTLVGPDVGGSDIVGIYRIDGPNSFTVVADIGEFASNNPPGTPFDVETGVQYALETYRGEFLVTDGHHNRVYRVTRAGEVSVLIAFGNIVPTGLETSGNTIYMAEAGPVPHLPQDGKMVSFKAKSPSATEVVASGAPLLVDVEFGRGRDLYALSQGDFGGGPAGSPAMPNTGSLVKVNGDGTFSTVVGPRTVVGPLNQPTSVEFIGNTAYVVTLTGEIWKVENPSGPPHGASH
jgi:hypothetical protein